MPGKGIVRDGGGFSGGMEFGLLDYGDVDVFLSHQLLELHGLVFDAIYVELQDFEMLVHFGGGFWRGVTCGKRWDLLAVWVCCFGTVRWWGRW